MSTNSEPPHGSPGAPGGPAALSTGTAPFTPAYFAPVRPTSPPAARSRRLLSALALTVAGTLLGAGVVAWQTHTPPFANSPCWTP